MAIDKKIFDVGFSLGWYSSFFNYAKVRKQPNTITWAQENMSSVINAVCDEEISHRSGDINDFVSNVFRLYGQFALKNDPNSLDYWPIGQACAYMCFAKKMKDAGMEKNLVQHMKKGSGLHIKNVSTKTILFKAKFNDFLEFAVDELDIDKFESKIDVIGVVSDVIYNYLTKPINRKVDAFVLVQEIAKKIKASYDLQDEPLSYPELYNEISEFGRWEEYNKSANTHLDFVNTTTNTNPYVFISYSSKNEVAAQVMRDLLIKESISNWMAPYDIPAGLDYPTVISEAIENCSCVLLLLSNQAQSSRYVYSEIRIAYDANKPIISMNLDDCQLIAGFKLLLGTHQIVSAKNDDDLQKVINAIKFNLNKNT